MNHPIKIETYDGKTVRSIEFDGYEEMVRGREEYRRRERMAVGRICRCGNCLCCEELTKHKENK